MNDVNLSEEFVAGNIYSWAQLSRIHRIRNGVYQRNGRLISLLTDFGRINPCYPDVHGNTADTVIYTGSGRRGDQKLDTYNRALVNAVDAGIEVPLFNKLSPGNWAYLGLWRVTASSYSFDEGQKRMLWQFILKRAARGDNGGNKEG